MTVWKCPRCQNTWFKSEYLMEIHHTDIKLPPWANAPFKNTRRAYICIECGRVLKELHEG